MYEQLREKKMSKSRYKVPYIGREMWIKCIKLKRKNILFYDKNTLLPFCFVNKEVGINRGSHFKKYTYRKKQLGLKLGEFVKTRKAGKHPGRRVKISKKRPKLNTFFKYDLRNKFFTS